MDKEKLASCHKVLSRAHAVVDTMEIGAIMVIITGPSGSDDHEVQVIKCGEEGILEAYMTAFGFVPTRTISMEDN